MIGKHGAGGAEGAKDALGSRKPSAQDGPVLHVDLIKGRNLIKTDIMGKSDPYAVLKYGDQKDKTKVVKNSLNPQWDHSSDFASKPRDNNNLM